MRHDLNFRDIMTTPAAGGFGGPVYSSMACWHFVCRLWPATGSARPTEGQRLTLAGRMQLVDSEVHAQTGHTGGFWQVNKFCKESSEGCLRRITVARSLSKRTFTCTIVP